MNKMSILSITAALLAPLAALPAAEAVRKPNIVFIVADDLGYGDLVCYGGKLAPTPSIDALARGGIRCTDGYVTAPVCAPSRCGIMTGAYNQRFGMQWNEDHWLGHAYSVPATHRLLPQALKAADYVTGHIGKWNIGSDIKNNFDETYDVIDWEADYFPKADGHYVGVDDPKKSDSSKINGAWGPEKPGDEYLTDRIGRHAVEFIDKHQAQPFFLYLAFNAVHSPWSAKTAYRERFAHIKDPPLNLYAAMLTSLDENVGRVLAKLKAAGLEENTLVVFISDNGPAQGGAYVKGWPDSWPRKIVVGSAGPLRGHKAEFLEGGIREPFILRWPARLKPGETYHQPVSTMDLYPTFCAAAGAPVPAGTKLDGVNLLPYLSGEKPGAPHEILFWKTTWSNGDEGAVRQGDWKLLINKAAPRFQLFNLAEDQGEEHDLAVGKTEQVEKLHQAWLDWGATLPPRSNPPSTQPGKGRQPVAAGAKPVQDRSAIFDLKDKNLDGRLSQAEFLASQPDLDAAKTRFGQWDANKDGFLSRGEFVGMGKAAK
jgi:arylsulfatase A-like enzyme